MGIINKKTFLNSATSATTSDVLMNINTGSSLVLEFTGTATSFTANVQGIVGDYNEDSWTTLKTVNLNSFATATDISTNGIYMVGCEGIVKLRVQLTAVSGGNVTCVGKLAD